MSRQLLNIGTYINENGKRSDIFPGGWYQNSDYYITGKTNGIKYIATLSSVIPGDVGTIKVFNNVRDLNNGNTVVTDGEGVTNGKFRYDFSSNNDWKLDGPLDKEAYDISKGKTSKILKYGGSKRRHRTRKSRKVKKRRHTKRRRY